MVSEGGYIKVRVGCDHPLADPNGYAYEHAMVWISAGNPPLGPGEIIHHKDKDKTNNRINNLEVMTRADHCALHVAEYWKGRKGDV